MLPEKLRSCWELTDDAFTEFASLIASEDQILATTIGGELWLLKPKGDGVEVVSKLRVWEGDAEMYAYPALAGRRLFLRGRQEVVCLPLEAAPPAALAATDRRPAAP